MNTNLLPPVVSLARARRICAIGTLLAIVATSVLLTLALLAAIDVALPFPRSLRIPLVGAGWATLIAWIVFRWRETRRRHTPQSAAQVMEAAYPELGQRVRTAMEVSQSGDLESGTPEAKLFAQRLIAQSEEAVTRLSWRSLVPRGRWALWIAALAGVGILIGMCASRWPDFRLGLARFVSPATAGTYTELRWEVAPSVFDDHHPPRFALTVERRIAEPKLFVRERGGAWVKTGMTPLPDGRSWDVLLTGRTTDLELYATAGDASTVKHTIKFKPIPKLTAAHVQLTYPEYTGLKPETREQGDVSVVEDTRVRWTFSFNIPPDRVEWSVGSEPVQRLKVDPSTKTASVDWTAGNSRLSSVVSVIDERGETIDSWRYTAEGFADALPTVELLEPVKDQEATSVTELPVRIRAKDDFGVSEVGLVVEAAGQREWALEKVIPEHNQRNVTELATAMLEKVPVTLRDNVRLYAYALDHKARGGPRAVSALRSIDIREFKKHWRFQESTGGGGDMKQVTDGIMKLGKIITTQRGIVSDTFLLRESARSAGVAVTASAAPIGHRELDLSLKATELQEAWLDKGGIPKDDVTLLDTSIAQMIEASESLGLKGPANVEKGFDTTDRALSTLLQLRKRLLTILSKSNCPCEEPKPEEQFKPLAELAKEAERLAREEHDVQDQLAPDVAPGTNVEATRRQHEVVVTDGGELYAEIVDHPQSNEVAVRLMDRADKAVRGADETLHGSTPQEARPLHQVAEGRLLEVAEFLRAMELTQTVETLKKLANKAEQDAKAALDSGAGGKPTPRRGEEPKQTASSRCEPVQKAARNTDLADQILGALAEKAGATGQKPEAGADGSEPSLGDTLAELRAQTGPAKLAEELGKLAELQKKGDGDAGDEKRMADSAGGKLEQMARDFRDTAQRIEASRAARLAEAQAQAKELKKQLANTGNKPGGKDGKQGKKGEGAGNKPGEKPGLAKADKPGENGDGQKRGEKGDGKNGQQGEKPTVASGTQSGTKPGERGLAKGEQPGKTGQGDKPIDGKKTGSGGIAGDIEEAKNGPGGQAMGRFSKALRSIGDDQLNDFAIKLFNAPFSRDSLLDVEGAAERIEALLAELPAAGAVVASNGQVPEARRREVEDYFRNLSDDFGGEEWNTEATSGQKTP